MRRREFVAALGGMAAFACAARAEHPERVRRVGVLIYGAEDDPVTGTRVEGLREGLHRLDWVEGRNLALDFHFGAADPSRIRAGAKEIVARGPDVIVTGAAPATRAVLELTQTIPVVFVEVTNETGYGVTGSLARGETQQHRHHQSLSRDRRALARNPQGGGAASLPDRPPVQSGVRFVGLSESDQGGGGRLPRGDDPDAGAQQRRDRARDHRGGSRAEHRPPDRAAAPGLFRHPD